jgi:hypothetical protein
MSTKVITGGKQLLILFSFMLTTVLVNWPILLANFIYPEQPLFYNANQLIHSFSDLLHLYTHPMLLDSQVLFSRPSGFYLLYQLLTPVLGWHNINGLVIVNWLFLGATGYVLFKIYQELFTGYVFGGLIAFSIYLMTPGLILAKMVIMHFEYAYVFFVWLSLYCFIMFCKKNRDSLQEFKHYGWLFSTIIFYILAQTFKEASMMLGPVLGIYLLLQLYKPGKFWATLKAKDNLKIIFLLGVVTLTLITYSLLSWSTHSHPSFKEFSTSRLWEVALKFTGLLFNLSQNHQVDGESIFKLSILDLAQMPSAIKLLINSLQRVTLAGLFLAFSQKNIALKKSLLFLLSALILFLLLPWIYTWGFPWHLSLSYSCEALLMGFGIDFFVRHFVSIKIHYAICISLALLLAATTYPIDRANIDFLFRTQLGFASKLLHNALSHPPDIKHKLNPESILVVQDSLNIGDYLLGDSAYPVEVFAGNNAKFNFDTLFPDQQRNVLWRWQPVFNGTIFRWAYLLPGLQEEVVPFNDNDMSLVTDSILLSWIRHSDNIVCLAYDKNGFWFDNTNVFKKDIILEQQRRFLTAFSYLDSPKTASQSPATSVVRLPYGDPGMCQTMCDKNRSCNGFTYTKVKLGYFTLAKCIFYNKLVANQIPCDVCTTFMKQA